MSGAFDWIADKLGFGEPAGKSIVQIVQEHVDARYHVTTDPQTGAIVTATPGALEALADGYDVFSEPETDPAILRSASGGRLTKVALLVMVLAVVYLIATRRRSEPVRRRAR